MYICIYVYIYMACALDQEVDERRGPEAARRRLGFDKNIKI